MNSCDILLIGYEEGENLGLRSIAAFLNMHGINVWIEPYGRSSNERILSRILEAKPKIVGFSLIFQRMLYDFGDFISYLRQNGVRTHFTMGGHFPSVDYRGTLETISGLDSVVRCEGEETLLDLYRRIEQPGLWSQIKGLAYRKNGEVTVTPPRPLIQNLDSLPFPIRNKITRTHRGLGICSILSSRGCYYDCSFCSIKQFYSRSHGPNRRTRSVSNVVQEMEQLFHEHGIRIFIFEDDDFLTKTQRQRQWGNDFIKELKKRKIGDQIIWRISCRVDDVDAELIKGMMEVGLISIYIGIESGNNQGLSTYNKHYTVNDIYETINLLQEIKIQYEFGFMLLNPDSTLATVREDISFLKEIGSTGQAVVNFTKMLPYAGTPIANRLENEGRLEGTIASPDYKYQDPKLDLLQLFFTQAFHFRNFDNNGLVERLRHIKFDSIVLEKFYSDKYETHFYSQTIRDLIRESNAHCLEKMSLAVRFIEDQNEEEIVSNWHVLERFIDEERNMELHITSYLDLLMKRYYAGQ